MSAERDHELERLAIAEQHVEDAERHITEQLARIEKLEGEGHPIDDAERLLVPLNAMLMEWITQRDEIVRRLKQLDQKDR